MGDLEIELYWKHAPETCRNFAELSRRGYYNGVIFHRIISDFMVQGGDPTGTGIIHLLLLIQLSIKFIYKRDIAEYYKWQCDWWVRTKNNSALGLWWMLSSLKASRFIMNRIAKLRSLLVALPFFKRSQCVFSVTRNISTVLAQLCCIIFAFTIEFRFVIEIKG